MNEIDEMVRKHLEFPVKGMTVYNQIETQLTITAFDKVINNTIPFKYLYCIHSLKTVETRIYNFKLSKQGIVCQQTNVT